LAKTAAPRTGTIRVGVGGWTFEPWRGVFYPEGLTRSTQWTLAAVVLGVNLALYAWVWRHGRGRTAPTDADREDMA